MSEQTTKQEFTPKPPTHKGKIYKLEELANKAKFYKPIGSWETWPSYQKGKQWGKLRIEIEGKWHFLNIEMEM